MQTPVFVGRHKEIEQLNTVLKTVQGGSGSCVLISGDAGIGKSRLVAEIRASAERMDFETLIGRCFEQDRSFPFAPLIDMLRPFFAQSLKPDQLEVVGPIAPQLIKLLPELAFHYTVPPSVPLHDSEFQKRQLFEALISFFWRQAESLPHIAHCGRPALERSGQPGVLTSSGAAHRRQADSPPANLSRHPRSGWVVRAAGRDRS
jgi:hypothetical protein